VVLETVCGGFIFTEGPLWDPRDGSLYFSDIPANKLYRWTQAGGAQVFRNPSGKSNGLTWDLQGRLTACEHLNRRVSRTGPDGAVVSLTERRGGKLLNSPNDLVFRSDGVMFFSDPPYGLQSAEFGEIREQEQPLNGLYSLRPGSSEPELLVDDFERPNGLAFSPDERVLYVADTPRYHVRRFNVAGDGSLSGGEVFVQLAEEQGVGRPDGMKVDVAGNVYTTGPGGLWILAPCGTILAQLLFPERTANCGWGDPDYRSLYVTASTSVYRLRGRIPGVVPHGVRTA
jgi:gluconolactonase